MKIKNRIRELRRINASNLLPNPRNWRQHPVAQQNALRGVLADVGWADAGLARVTPERLMLIDGHVRTDLAADEGIPVLILDVDEKEADLFLATLVLLAGMATTNREALDELFTGQFGARKSCGVIHVAARYTIRKCLSSYVVAS